MAVVQTNMQTNNNTTQQLKHKQSLKQTETINKTPITQSHKQSLAHQQTGLKQTNKNMKSTAGN